MVHGLLPAVVTENLWFSSTISGAFIMVRSYYTHVGCISVRVLVHLDVIYSLVLADLTVLADSIAPDDVTNIVSLLALDHSTALDDLMAHSPVFIEEIQRSVY